MPRHERKPTKATASGRKSGLFGRTDAGKAGLRGLAGQSAAAAIEGAEELGVGGHKAPTTPSPRGLGK